MEIERLAAAVDKHRKAYEAGRPNISDGSWDGLVRLLHEMAPAHPGLEMVGTVVEGVVNALRVKHSLPMLSLDRTWSREDVQTWRRVVGGRVVVSPKVDGVALSAVYRDGFLVSAATRGDGRVGQSVLDAAMGIRLLPGTVPMPYTVELRGEVYLPNASRALAAAKLRAGDGEGLRFVCWDVIGGRGGTYTERMTAAKELMPWVEFVPVLDAVVEDAVRQLDDVRWPTDGLVYRMDDDAAYIAAGATAHHPRGALALKWAELPAHTELLGVEWSVGATGRLTPVGLVRPVKAAGQTISRVNLRSWYQVAKQFKLAVGDLLELDVMVGGASLLDVVVRGDGPLVQGPAACPACGGRVLRPDERYDTWRCERVCKRK